MTLSIYFPSEDILQAVTAFNQSNPDYYVELLSGIGADNTPSINQITVEEYWTQETLEIFAAKDRTFLPRLWLVSILLTLKRVC